MQKRLFTSPKTLLPLLAIAGATLAFNIFGGARRQQAESASLAPPARALPDNTAGSEYTIRFLSERVRRDPDDFSAQNRLASAYLGRLHATSNHKYLPLALKAAHASLRSVPAESNSGGLTVLALTELANHEFGLARDHALRLNKLDPGKGEPQAILGDALLELGDYQGAARAFAQMQEAGGRSIETETRLARLAVLHGQTEAAQKHFATALALALNLPSPPRETVAWCRWQMGETAFGSGDLESAERHFRDALTTYPGYFRALAGLGRVLAAKDDLPGAIEQYERAVRVVPDPDFLASLGDLYHLAGRQRDADARYELAQWSDNTEAGRAHQRLHARQKALFLANHDLQAPAAYALAKADYAVRRDIYGADALAWTALKAGHVDEAKTAMKAALRLGTRDAKLFYHAGMIALAAGDKKAGTDFLQSALALNPHFDPLQAVMARKTLENTTP